MLSGIVKKIKSLCQAHKNVVTERNNGVVVCMCLKKRHLQKSCSVWLVLYTALYSYNEPRCESFANTAEQGASADFHNVNFSQISFPHVLTPNCQPLSPSPLFLSVPIRSQR